ncbi:MAG: hypothetical protein ABIY70_13435 [Capsulimonas sp.]|uniref:hypothetical protein n=1 Tax=Capsulimonas sp. TaxID=2494211 RepID=UPI003262F28F
MTLDFGDAWRIAALVLCPIIDWRVSIHLKRSGAVVSDPYGRVVNYATFACFMIVNGVSRHLHSASAKEAVFAACTIPLMIVMGASFYYRWRDSKRNAADVIRQE